MLLRVEPFKGDGTQDPLTWLEDFDKAAQANKWNLARKKDIFAAFLRDNAEDWTTTVNDYADPGTNWNAVTTAFKNTFCTQRWQNKWLRDLDTLKQGPEEPVEAYNNRFKRLIKRVEARAALQDAQKLYYFKKRLRPATLPILLTHNPANLNDLFNLAKTYEQGADFATNADPSVNNPNIAACEKEIEQLTKQMNQMSLKYASIASALSAQTELQYHPKQTKQFYQKPRPTNNSRPNVICYRCSEQGHYARDCMAERLPTKEQRYQMNSRPQMKQKIYYVAVEEEYYSDEDEVYVTRALVLNLIILIAKCKKKPKRSQNPKR